MKKYTVFILLAYLCVGMLNAMDDKDVARPLLEKISQLSKSCDQEQLDSTDFGSKTLKKTNSYKDLWKMVTARNISRAQQGK